MSIQPGQRLGNYVLLRQIGQGGFADVYLGQHIYLNTYAAIKVLQSRMTEEDFASFKTEAQTIAHLTHPHIVRVLEFGKEEKQPFLVMDYCPDGTLRRRHPRGTQISLAECVDYVKQVAMALDYAHGMKVIHRDIKPENMLVGKEGSILLSDFGIAIAAHSSRYLSRQDVGGTLAYMAPEQFDGRSTFASDQYALGVVIYEWLSGETPFTGSPTEILAQQFKGNIPPLRAKRADLSPSVEFVVQKALSRDPQQRFCNVQELALALEEANQGDISTTLQVNRDTGSSPTTLKALPNQSDIATQRDETGQSATIPAAGQARNPFPNPPVYAPTVAARPPYASQGVYLPQQIVFSSPPPPPRKSTARTVAIALGLICLIVILPCICIRPLSEKLPDLIAFLEDASPTPGSTGSKGTPATQATKASSKKVPAKDGTLTKNIRLTCGGCNDPLVVTITTITIDSASGRMAWGVMLFNNTQSAYRSYNYSFREFSLQAATESEKVEASNVQEETIPPEQSITLKRIFSFVPFKDVTYTLRVKIYMSGVGDTVNFDPVDFTFS